MIIITLAAPLFLVALVLEWRLALRRTLPIFESRDTDITTYNPLRIATHELVAIAGDVRAATTWSERFGRVFRGPGWQPAGPATMIAEPEVSLT